eukprot:1069587-Prymnesium_polylepis.1
MFEFRQPRPRGRPRKQPAASGAAETPRGPARRRGCQSGRRSATSGLDPGSADAGGPRERRQADAFSPAKEAESNRQAAA